MSNNPPQRRWYQFSLRTLLVLLIVGCVVFGWVNVRMNRARTNRERVASVDKLLEKAVTEIEALGGRVQDYGFVQQRSATWLEEWFGDPGGPDDPVDVWRATIVLFGATNVGLERLEGALQHLEGPTNQEYLLVIDSEWHGKPQNRRKAYVTDTGLEHLKGLANLKQLYLRETFVTDEGVKKLQQALPNCRIIH